MTVNSWYEANLICEDLGGFLMEPKAEEIQDLLSSLLLMLPGLSAELDWWIGLTDTGHEGSWLWVREAEFAEEQFWGMPPDSSEGNHADCALLSRCEKQSLLTSNFGRCHPTPRRETMLTVLFLAGETFEFGDMGDLDLTPG